MTLRQAQGKKVVLFFILLALAVYPEMSRGATFAKDPLFLSRTPVTEGQTVHIYAVISNPDTSAFTGTLVFYDGTQKIGSSDVSLAAGATQTESTLWTPSAGTHPLSAQLVTAGGTVAEQVAQSVAINPKPSSNITTPAQSAATIDSSAAIQKDIAGVSPQVASASTPVFSVIDGVRNSIADTLDGQIVYAKNKIAATPNFAGAVEGTSTSNVLTDAKLPSQDGVWHWLYTFYLWLLQALRWLVGNAGIFYPVLAILFLLLIYRMYRRFRRPY